MPISEPMTVLTDWLLAALVLWFAARLARQGRQAGQASVIFWAGAFLAASLAAAAGGAWHGFHLSLPAPAASLLWKITLYALGLASFGLLASAALACLRGGARRTLLLLAALKFFLYAGWMAGHDSFRFVIYDYGSAMLAILVLQIPAVRRRAPSAIWVAAGILLSFGAAAIQASGLAPHPQFNHNDLYHVVQMGAFWLLYRGGRLLTDRSSED